MIEIEKSLKFSPHIPGISQSVRNEESNDLSDDSDIRIAALTSIPNLLNKFPKASLAYELLIHDPQITRLWNMSRYITTHKMGMNDHGKTHALVATASAIRILTLLCESDITPDIVSSEGGDLDDAYVVVLVSSLCHDLGNAVHRFHHISHSLLLMQPILDHLLPVLYDDLEKSMLIRTFIYSAVYTHHGDPKPITIEASIVSVGDASDMTKGRALHIHDKKDVTMHALSALSIDQVIIKKGRTKPVEIQIIMSKTAGMYQIQEIMTPKIMAGCISQYIEVTIPYLENR